MKRLKRARVVREFFSQFAPVRRPVFRGVPGVPKGQALCGLRESREYTTGAGLVFQGGLGVPPQPDGGSPATTGTPAVVQGVPAFGVQEAAEKPALCRAGTPGTPSTPKHDSPGAAGELAATILDLPWPKDAASSAAATCLKEWLEKRGGSGAHEVVAGIAQVRRFIEQHGESRFSHIQRSNPISQQHVAPAHRL